MDNMQMAWHADGHLVESMQPYQILMHVEHGWDHWRRQQDLLLT